MAKRKSSKTTAQSDPTTTEDVAEVAVGVETSESQAQVLEDDTVSAIGDAETEIHGDSDVTGADEVEVALEDAPEMTDDIDVVESEPASEPEMQTTVPASIVQPAPKSNTFVPMLLGGVIAATLGFVAARTEVLDPILPQSMRSSAAAAIPAFDDSALTSGLDALTGRLTELEATVADLPEPQVSAAPQPAPDLSGIEADIAALSAKIADLANQPVSEAPVPTEALDAALSELRATASEQQAEIDRLLADQRTSIQDAETAANATLARTAMTSIQSAIDTGVPFAAPLGELEKTGLTEVPQILSDVANDGVKSLAALQDTMPGAARDALAAARDSETGTGLSGFIQRQLGARAVEPREGSDPDAILSRIEAATRAGNLDAALAEAATLPALAQDAMNTWIEQAQSRQMVVSAANALAERLSAF